ncbi:MAG: hypothetical protein HQK49_15015 [Oligoflexia bacterium]|nr:hypothetical protein [Oligoflexia bacterium]
MNKFFIFLITLLVSQFFSQISFAYQLEKSEAIIDNATSVRINGGINPQIKGYRIQGRVNNVNAQSLIKSLPDLDGDMILKEKAIILDLATAPVNGGINPLFRGVKIEGKVMLGANNCQATGVTAEINIYTDADGITHLEAIRVINKKLQPLMCTMEYMPVYFNFTKEIRTTKAIIIHNVEQLDSDVTL